MEQNKVKKKRAPTALLIACTVCGAPAPDHLHFGGHCCYSCRAFFRRTIERMEKTDIVCRTGLRTCEVSEMSKACSACRYQKCLQVGMSVSLLQGKRKKKDTVSEESHQKVQKVINEMPELERIPRYNPKIHQAFPTNQTLTNLPQPEARNFQDTFKFPGLGPENISEESLFLNSPRRQSASQPGHLGECSSKGGFNSRIMSTSEGHPGYKNPEQFVGVIQGTSRPQNIIQSSVIQTSGVIRSSRTSVIQHGPSLPQQTRLVPTSNMVERWTKSETLPRTLPYNSSLLLRYESSLMKYQADLCKERSQVLDKHARLLEQQEARNNRFLPPPPASSTPTSDWNTRHNSQDNILVFSDQKSHTENILVKPLHQLPDIYQNKVIKTETDDPPSPDEVETRSDDLETTDEDQDQQLLLRQDIKQFFADLIEHQSSEYRIKTSSFQSNVFLEAENLLTHSPFITLLTTNSKDPKEHTQRDGSKAKETKVTVKVEKDATEEGVIKKELKVLSTPANDPELKFTATEMDWVDKIQQTMAISTKSVIREEVYQAVIDNWRGLITHGELLGILAQGKARQAYMHILIMSNLPYFQDLTSRAQRWLMKSAAAVGMELMTAVFFFGHSSDTLIGQAESCAVETNFKKYIETKAAFALKMPARNYETLYKSPWADTIEQEIKHKRGQQLIGESLKGKDKRIMPLLYALAVFAVSEAEIEQVDLPNSDKETIKKAQDHLGIIYKRFLKQLHGWKAASGYAMSHIYFLSLLKENVTEGLTHHSE